MQQKKLYRFVEDCTFDDPKLGSAIHYKAGDTEHFYPRQVKYMRHALEEVVAVEKPKKAAKADK